MGRGIALVLAGFAALAGGCATPARYVEKSADSGIIAIPTNQGIFGGYNEREATKLIQQHVGSDYEIVDAREVVTGQTTLNNQQMDGQQTANRRNPNQPGFQQNAMNTTTTQDTTEWRIWYRRKASLGRPGQPVSGVMQTGGVQRPLGQNVVPSVLPGGGVGGPTSYFAPTPRTPSGAACSS